MSDASEELGADAHLDWPEFRRAALRRVGVSQADLAARIGVSRQSIGLVIADHHRSRRVEDAIAEAVGVDVAALFPPSRAVAASSSTGGEPERDSTSPQPAEVEPTPGDATVELEDGLAAELRAIAERVLLAIADRRLAADRPIVRAVAAAIRELAR